MYPSIELLKTFHFDEAQLGTILALLARGPTVVPDILADLQAAKTDGSLLARDVIAAYQAADETLQGVAAAGKAKAEAAAVKAKADAAAARAAAVKSAVRVGGKIQPPTKIKDVKPVYPAIAQSARISGVVTVEATIGPDGKVIAAKVVRSVPMLDQAALDAVQQWEYTPALLNGQPVPVVVTATINFTR